MSRVHAVLLIPEDGDPHGLLHEGPCGARPPRAWCCDWETDDEGETWAAKPRWLPARSYTSAARHALVLAWDGEPVAEGCLRAGIGCAFEPRSTVDIWIHDLLVGSPADVRMWDALGTLVLLDAEGQEVSDE